MEQQKMERKNPTQKNNYKLFREGGTFVRGLLQGFPMYQGSCVGPLGSTHGGAAGPQGPGSSVIGRCFVTGSITVSSSCGCGSKRPPSSALLLPSLSACRHRSALPSPSHWCAENTKRKHQIGVLRGLPVPAVCFASPSSALLCFCFACVAPNHRALSLSFPSPYQY